MPTAEPLLEVHDIQGSILAGFNKDDQILLALKIRDVRAAKLWLQRIAPEISSTAEVLQFNALFRTLRRRLGRDPDGFVATWVSIAFSRNALAALTSEDEVARIPDEAFRIGLTADRASGLGDPVAAGEPDPTKDWVVGGTKRPVDILMTVASDDPKALDAKVRRIRPGPADDKGAPRLIWKERGRTRPDLPGHEHFGFKDGVSQPGVRGLISREPDVFLTPRFVAPSGSGTVEFSAPGQPLVWPGQFVLGYPSSDRSTGEPVEAGALTPAWIRNGSFLVFRRLRQDVPGFDAFLRATAAMLATQPALSGLTPERFGALLVGRWRSGAPLSRSPTQDSAALAADNLSNNDFLFTTDTPAPIFLPDLPRAPGTFPIATEDTSGSVCPRAAHIRKMNPRDQTTNLGDPFDTLTRRILRRGIPYGAPLDQSSGSGEVDRGLHFLCYQTSIEEQFEKLQQDWANNTIGPTAGGHDVIIGQSPASPPDNTLTFQVPDASGPLTGIRQFVTPTGGGYFFAPSLTAVREVLAHLA